MAHHVQDRVFEEEDLAAAWCAPNEIDYVTLLSYFRFTGI